MEEKKMLKVTVDGKAYSYPYGTPYRAIAADFQDQSPWDILLVNREGKLCELHKVLDRDCTLKMVTAREKPGIQTYERSAVFLMLKAFYDVAGRENVERLSVEYSLSSALFILAKGSFTLDQDLLARVEARMRELSAAAVPIEKRSISTDDAVELFRQNRMPHKAHLLSFRINSHVNVYSLDGFVDYFYGYMAPDTSYVKCFGLELFENGFVLRLPTQKDPGQLGEFRPSIKVFRELYVKLDEELEKEASMLFSGNQIQPQKTVGALRSRRWVADYEDGLQKIYYKENIVACIYAMADWFSPSDVEAPTLEYVVFTDRKTGEALKIKEIPDIIYSEVMRDVDLAVSVAHAGGVDPETSHSTIEMRKAIAACSLSLFRTKNVRLEGNHAIIDGKLGQYTVHLGSGVVHQIGNAMLFVVPVHSQHRGRIFLPFVDDDPKTAEILSKILLFAEDTRIKDPNILRQIQ